MSDEIVDVYDFSSKEIRRVPVGELPLHFVRIKIDGIDNVCWADPNQLQQGPYQHPPFDAQRRAAIQQIKDGIDEVYPMSLEKWEDGFRRDRNPDSEIAIWLRVVATYRSAIAVPRTLAAKKDIFRILSACTFSTPEHVLESAKLNALSKDEAACIIADYLSKAGSSPLPPLKVEEAETKGPMERKIDEKPKRRRPWFQFHLSTALGLAFLAGGILWLNSLPQSRPFKMEGLWDVVGMRIPNVEESYGWPYCYQTIIWSRYGTNWLGTGPENSEYSSTWHSDGFWLDVAIAVSILILYAAAAEFLIHRRRKPIGGEQGT